MRQERGWKVFSLIPRLSSHRKTCGGTVPREKLVQRVNEEGALKIARRRSTRQGKDGRDQLVHLGELSSARQVLDSAELAKNTRDVAFVASQATQTR